jgi:hypothetical protein
LTTRIVYFRNFDILSYTLVFRGSKKQIRGKQGITISARYLKNLAIIEKPHEGAGRYEAGGNGPKLVREEGEPWGNGEVYGEGEEKLYGEWEAQ